MQKRWRKLVAILGVSVMLITQSFSALASENEPEEAESEALVEDSAIDVTDDTSDSDVEAENQGEEEADAKDGDNVEANDADVEVDNSKDSNDKIDASVEVKDVDIADDKEAEDEADNDEQDKKDGEVSEELSEAGMIAVASLDDELIDMPMAIDDEVEGVTSQPKPEWDGSQNVKLTVSDDVQYKCFVKIQQKNESGDFIDKTVSNNRSSNITPNKGTLTVQVVTRKTYDKDTGKTVWGNSDLITEAGIYKVQIQYGDAYSSWSEPFEYAGREVLGKPVAEWSSEEDGLLEWSTVDNADSYTVLLYKTIGDSTEFVRQEYVFDGETSVDLENYLEEGAEYFAVVCAVTGNLTTYIDGDYSEQAIYQFQSSDEGGSDDDEGDEELVGNIVTDLKWNNIDDEEDGLIKWDAMDGVSKYWVKIQVNGGYIGEKPEFVVDTNSYDLTEYYPDSSLISGEFVVAVAVADDAANDNSVAPDDSMFAKSVAKKIYIVINTENCVTEPSDDSSNSDNSDSSDTSDTIDTTTTTEEPQPTIGSSGAGWSSMSDEVNQAIANATKAAMEAVEAGTEVGTNATAVVSVNLNGTDTVPASAISAIAGKDVVLNLNVNSTTSVNIKGSSLDASDAADVKLSAGTDSTGNATLNVRSQNSDINKSIDVFYKAGASNIGGNAVLNFVNADGSLVEFRNSIVYDNGYAAFTTPLVSANYKMSLK